MKKDYNIIIEGCDCVGKTSVINKIIQEHPEFELIKCSAPKNKKEALNEYLNIVHRLQTETGLIFDRALLGECIYGPKYRDYYPEYMRNLEKLIPINTMLVLLIADIATIEKRFDGEFIKIEHIPIIQKNYIEEFNICNYKTKCMLSTDDITPMELAELIIAKCDSDCSSDDKLKHMFNIQNNFQERLGTWEKISYSDSLKQQFINQMILALHEEATEIMRETAYKNPNYVPFGWKKSQENNYDKMKEEIVDIWHFVMNLAIISGMDSDEFYKIYLDKNKENHKRQDNKY